MAVVPRDLSSEIRVETDGGHGFTVAVPLLAYSGFGSVALTNSDVTCLGISANGSAYHAANYRVGVLSTGSGAVLTALENTTLYTATSGGPVGSSVSLSAGKLIFTVNGHLVLPMSWTIRHRSSVLGR